VHRPAPESIVNRARPVAWINRFLLVASILAAFLGPAGRCDAAELSPANPATIDPPSKYQLRDVAMVLRRTECLGSCPAYTLTIRGDGLCTLSGSGEPTWVQTYTIDSKNAMDVLDEFYGSDFFVLRTRYTEGRGPIAQDDGWVREVSISSTDEPHTILTLTIGTYSKTIDSSNDHGPKALRDIADHMDRISDAKGREERQRYRADNMPRGSKK
jgi:hypothetical protein